MKSRNSKWKSKKIAFDRFVSFRFVRDEKYGRVCVITRSKAENPPVSDSKAIDFERPTLKSSHYRFQDRDSPDEYG